MIYKVTQPLGQHILLVARAPVVCTLLARLQISTLKCKMVFVGFRPAANSYFLICIGLLWKTNHRFQLLICEDLHLSLL